jgi:hypothetical protein
MTFGSFGKSIVVSWPPGSPVLWPSLRDSEPPGAGGDENFRGINLQPNRRSWPSSFEQIEGVQEDRGRPLPVPQQGEHGEPVLVAADRLRR